MSWTSQILDSLAVIGASYLTGWVLRAVAARQLASLARRTSARWDDALAKAIGARMPFWALLLGLYLATGLWALPPSATTVINGGLFVLLVGSVTLLIADALTGLAREYGAPGQEGLPTTTLTQNVVRIAVVSVGGLIALNGLGIPITPILTALGVGGLAVALALQDTLANLFAGFYVTLARQVRVGDFIRLDSGQDGVLEDIAWRAARVRTLSNNTVVVPNAKLAQAVVVNYDLPDKETAVLVEVGVAYESDLGLVERVTSEVGRDVMQNVDGGVPTFEPFIRYHTFGEFSINFTVILRGRTFVDQYLLKHEFIKRLHERYSREGIMIPLRTAAATRAATAGRESS